MDEGTEESPRLELEMRIEMTFPGGLAVDAQYKGHTIHTDQPTAHGGGGTAPAPFDLFLASIGTCAGFYALRFCQQRELSTEGLRVALETKKAEGRVATVRLEVELPESFPDKYRSAIVRAIDQCTVKKHIVEPPEFEVDLLVREESAVVATAASAGAPQPPGRNTQ